MYDETLLNNFNVGELEMCELMLELMQETNMSVGYVRECVIFIGSLQIRTQFLI